MSKKIVIAAGGTGGHTFPAQALAEQLLKKDPTVRLLFLGHGLASSPFFDSRRWPHHDIQSAAFKSKHPLEVFRAARKITSGIAESRRILKSFKPDVVVGFGSYHTLPVLAATRLLRIPMVLHEGNSIPGKVNKLFSRYARVTGLHLPEAAEFLKGKTLVTGMPLRGGYDPKYGSQEEARKYFRLDPNTFTFLVFGGSQGALALNLLFSNAIVDHLSKRTKRYQIIHLTGDAILAEELEQLYEREGVRAYVRDFESNMDKAWQASDLIVSRAGASTIAEQMQMEVPGILVPYPHATDGHQDRNADHMVNEVGGAIKCYEAELTSERLAEAVSDLVGSKKNRIEGMQASIRRYKSEKKNRDLCSVVCEVAGMSVR